MCGLHGRLDVVGGGGRDARHLLLRRRVDHGDLGAGVGRLDPPPVDVEPASVSHRASSWSIARRRRQAPGGR